jgi:GT2 family glycosyltransferase
MPSVSVVVVNWNGAPLLADCLGSLHEQSFRDFEVVFVDNGSTDGSVTRARALLPDVRILEVGRNVGFARGNNLGIREARGRYLVLLNNDTALEPRFLEEIVLAAGPSPPVGMVAPKILSFFEPGVIDSVGGLVLTPDGIGQGRGRGEVDHGQYDGLRRVLCPSGCAALYRREMLDDIGLLAEEFFAYCEDSEIGLRATWAGWTAVAAPKAVVRHKYSASAGTYSPLKLRLVERNHYWLALRQFPLRLLLRLPLWSLYRFGVMGYSLAHRRGKGGGAAGQASRLLTAFVRGHLEALAGAPAQMARRREMRRRLGCAEFLAHLEGHRIPLRQAFLVA